MLVDAQTARAMQQKIQRVMPGINYVFIDQHPLLKIAQKNDNIKYKGSHTEFEWFPHKDDVSDPEWGGGELGLNTFEEQDPATRAHLPYCWLQKNYGVGDRTLEANRYSPDRIWKPVGANLKLAQIHMYKVIGPAIYNGATDGDGDSAPVGLKHVIGDACETSGHVIIAASKSYAGKLITNSYGVAVYAPAKKSVDASANVGLNEVQWSPEVLAMSEIPASSRTTAATNTKWSEDCIAALAYMEDEMALTTDLTGTGVPQKPDVALMARDPYNSLIALAVSSQLTYGVPAQLVDEDLRLAGWRNIMVGGLTCIKDNNVPDDAGDLERVIVLDSKQYFITTTHTKAEGLIRNESDTTGVIVNGVIGKLTANIGFYVKSPTAVGALLACDT